MCRITTAYTLRSTALSTDLAAYVVLDRACQKHINLIFGKITGWTMYFFDDPWSTTWMNIWHHVNLSTLMKSKSHSGFWYKLEQPPIIWLDLGFYFRTDLTVITVYCVSQSWQRYFEEIRIPKICLWKLRKMWQIGNEVIRGLYL